jgi:DNA-binding winged helix-turn-helix (wHTH) protein/tetratricopeptide (TPR) repeat protein
MALDNPTRPADPPARAADLPARAGRRLARLRFGAWLVDPAANTIRQGDELRQMEPRTMDVLLALCRAGGAIVSSEQLLETCWGSTLHGDSPVHKNIAQLRRLLGDQATAPVFIETIRKRGYRTVAPVAFDVDDAGRAARWERGSPFRGLLPFDESYAAVFHGRDEATQRLAGAAQAQIAAGLALLLLLGPSGAGKTSLVQAGLLPALARPQAGGAALLASVSFDVADQGEQALFVALAGALLDLHVDDSWVFENDNAVALGHRLEHAPDDVIAQLRQALAGRVPGLRFALFIDRFEALFNANRITEAERTAFLATLERLARSSCCLVVLACRNDFYPNIARYPLLMECKAHGGHVDLAPPGFSDIAQMIRKPAAAAQLRFGIDPATGAGLDDVLCESAAARPDVLPLLQYCLHELYRLRTHEGELSFDVFRALGGLEGTIGGRAEQVVLGLDEAQHAALPHIMSLVTVLSVDDEQVSSQRAPWSALRSEAARQALTALVDARLFVTDLAGGAPVFGIAHEAILRRWPRMRDWIAAHRAALRARARLAQQALRWDAEGRASDLLIPRGKPLDEARELAAFVAASGLWSLTGTEQELVKLSTRKARRFEVFRLSALGLIIALAILDTALALSAYRAQRSAEARRAEVEGLVDFMLGDFADKLRPLGKLELLDSVSGKALEYLRGSQGDTPSTLSALSPASLTLRARALQVIGEVSRSRGDAAQAIDALAKANAILVRQHAAAPRDVGVLNNLGINAYWIGQLHKDRNDLAAAEAAWRQYAQFTDRLHALEPDQPAWWIEQSYARNNLGSLAQARGQPAVAAGEFAASIALKKRALEHTPDDKMLIAELADSHSWLASARKSLGQLEAAGQLHQEALDLVGRLRTRYPDEPMWVHRQVRALQHRAALSLALGRDEAALRDFEAARALFASVAQAEQDNREWQVELANIELELLKVKARLQPPAALLAEFERVHAALAAAHRFDPENARWATSAAVARGRIAPALLATGEVARAQREIGMALAQLRRLQAANPASLATRLALVEAQLAAAAAHRAGRQPDLAQGACRQALDTLRPAMDTMDFEVLEPWARSTLCLPHSGDAGIPWRRLQQIGYRDSVYRQLTAVTPSP